MKRLSLFIVLSVVLFSCSMGQNFTDNREVEQYEVLAVVKNRSINVNKSGILTNEMFDLLNKSIETQNYSIYGTTKKDNKAVPRSGGMEKCPPHGNSSPSLQTEYYLVVDESVDPPRTLGVLKVVLAVYFCDRCGAALNWFVYSQEFFPS